MIVAMDATTGAAGATGAPASAGGELPHVAESVAPRSRGFVRGVQLDPLRLPLRGAAREAIWFGRIEPLPARVRLAFRLGTDRFQGLERVQLYVQAAFE